MGKGPNQSVFVSPTLNEGDSTKISNLVPKVSTNLFSAHFIRQKNYLLLNSWQKVLNVLSCEIHISFTLKTIFTKLVSLELRTTLPTNR